MTPYLARLVDRARGSAPRVKPVVAPRFAPPVSGEVQETDPPISPRSSAYDGRSREEDPHPRVNERVEETSQPDNRPADATAPEQRENEFAHFAEMAGPEIVPRVLRPAPPGSAIARAEGPQPQRPRNANGRSPTEEPAERAPIVRVTIGRIDVRAVNVPTPPVRTKDSARTPTLSLEAYLKSRVEGAR
jgi:hypothetical protein